MDNKKSPEESYIGQVWLAINYYSSILSLPCILSGDFNSNSTWDQKERVGNHTDVVEFLEKRGIHSLYHKQENENQGCETRNTFFMYRKVDKPYHIDYFFVSGNLIKDGYKLEISRASDWIDLSDHVPLILEMDISCNVGNYTISLYDFLKERVSILSHDTQRRFKDIIESLLKESNNIDDQSGSIELTQNPLNLIEMLDKLSRIDEFNKFE